MAPVGRLTFSINVTLDGCVDHQEVRAAIDNLRGRKKHDCLHG